MLFRSLALKDPQVRTYTDGKSIKKVVVVSGGKIVSIVVGD